MGDVDAEKHVVTCIQALYAQTNPALAKEADKWLKEFQIGSPLAWTTADRILRNTTLPYEVQYYAASTLYVRVQLLASIDLTPESRVSLRDSLISHISNHSKANEPLRLKLAQSIAVLALHMGTEWPQVVPDLVAAFMRSTDLMASLFSILEILPEESANYHSTSRVSKESVNAFRAQIRNAAPDMLRNLGNPTLLGNSKDVNAHAQLLRCFANWLRVCDDAQVPAALSGNNLVVYAFDALGNSDLFDSALSAVCELVLVSTHNELRQLMDYAISRAQGYLPAFKTAVTEEDEETYKGLCHLFTEMAEIYLPAMLAGDRTVLPLAEVMLECVAHTNTEIAAITFRFWQMLAEGLAKSNHKDIVAGFASSIFPRLFEHLYRVACYPDDYATWSNDLQEDFRETRKVEVATTLRTTCSIMGSSACFGKIAAILEKQLAPNGYPATGNWRLLEGAMFCMRSLARCVDAQPGTDPVVGSILKILPQLPNHKEIHYTSLLIVGRYADWLKTDPALLWPLFSYVVAALAHSDTAPSAAVSFKNICVSCAQTIAETHLQDILQVATNSMQSPQLHINDHVEVLDGVSQVISALPFDSGVSSLQTLCLPLLAAIRQHTSKSELGNSPLSDDLCKLATLFLCTKTFRNYPNRTAPIVEAIWPILEPIFAAHPTDTPVIDQLFRCIRYLLDNFPSSFDPSPTSSLLPTLFFPHEIHFPTLPQSDHPVYYLRLPKIQLAQVRVRRTALGPRARFLAHRAQAAHGRSGGRGSRGRVLRADRAGDARLPCADARDRRARGRDCGMVWRGTGADRAAKPARSVPKRGFL
eukprot:Phypoly_transcript_02122.p1 GENE.Phypoly_transcript_02122~~Phypoly_transcript_02122.p1  ORF type:complete len:815 (+),score=141.25 Phypoly_transcript_02122:51-2495(+)